MIKAIKHSFSFLILLLFSSVLIAQRDYAVTIKGDTMRGKIKRTFMGKQRMEIAGNKIILKPDSISMYYLAGNNETWCSRVLPYNSKPDFILRTVNGPIRLYSHTIDQGENLSVTHLFAEKDNIPIGEIKTSGLGGGRDERKEFFRSLIADNAEITKRFDEEDKFTFVYLRKLILEYNQQASGQTQ